MRGKTFGIVYGVISLSLLLGYILFVVYETKVGKRKFKLNAEDKIDLSIFKAVFFSFLGIVGVVLGADILVFGAVTTAKFIGISQVVIGLTVVALGTSLPEVVASMVAAYRGQIGFILGAILGSNLFNILGITGTAAIIAPIKSEGNLTSIDLFFLILSSIIFFFFTKLSAFVNRTLLALILISYLIYVLFLFIEI